MCRRPLEPPPQQPHEYGLEQCSSVMSHPSVHAQPLRMWAGSQMPAAAPFVPGQGFGVT